MKDTKRPFHAGAQILIDRLQAAADNPALPKHVRDAARRDAEGFRGAKAKKLAALRAKGEEV